MHSHTVPVTVTLLLGALDKGQVLGLPRDGFSTSEVPEIHDSGSLLSRKSLQRVARDQTWRDTDRAKP